MQDECFEMRYSGSNPFPKGTRTPYFKVVSVCVLFAKTGFACSLCYLACSRLQTSPREAGGMCGSCRDVPGTGRIEILAMLIQMTSYCGWEAGDVIKAPSAGVDLWRVGSTHLSGSGSRSRPQPRPTEHPAGIGAGRGGAKRGEGSL